MALLIHEDNGHGPWAWIKDSEGGYWLQNLPPLVGFHEPRCYAEVRDTLSKQPVQMLGTTGKPKQWRGTNVLLGPGFENASIFVVGEEDGSMTALFALAHQSNLEERQRPQFGLQAAITKENDEWKWEIQRDYVGWIKPFRRNFIEGTCDPAIWQPGCPATGDAEDQEIPVAAYPALRWIRRDANGRLELVIDTVADLIANVSEGKAENQTQYLLKAQAEVGLESDDPNIFHRKLGGTETPVTIKRRTTKDQRTGLPLHTVTVDVGQDEEGRDLMLPHLGLHFGGYFGSRSFSSVTFLSYDGVKWSYMPFNSRFKPSKKPKLVKAMLPTHTPAPADEALVAEAPNEELEVENTSTTNTEVVANDTPVEIQPGAKILGATVPQTKAKKKGSGKSKKAPQPTETETAPAESNADANADATA